MTLGFPGERDCVAVCYTLLFQNPTDGCRHAKDLVSTSSAGSGSSDAGRWKSYCRLGSEVYLATVYTPSILRTSPLVFSTTTQGPRHARIRNISLLDNVVGGHRAIPETLRRIEAVLVFRIDC